MTGQNAGSSDVARSSAASLLDGVPRRRANRRTLAVERSAEVLLAGAADGSPATDEDIRRAARQLGVTFPDDLVAFYRRHGAADGDLATDPDDDDAGWLILYPVDELVGRNAGYDHRDERLVIVGTDGGAEAYALDLRHSPPTWVVVPFLDLDVEHAIPAGGSLADFVLALADGSYWDRRPEPS